MSAIKQQNQINELQRQVAELTARVQALESKKRQASKKQGTQSAA